MPCTQVQWHIDSVAVLRDGEQSRRQLQSDTNNFSLLIFASRKTKKDQKDKEKVEVLHVLLEIQCANSYAKAA